MAEKIIYNIDVDADDAIHSIEQLNSSFDGTTARSDSAASSMSRLSSAQGTLDSTTKGLNTSIISESSELTKVDGKIKDTNKSTKELVKSNDSLRISNESLASTYDGVAPTNLTEFLHGTTSASKELISAMREMDYQIEMTAQSNVGMGASEKELSDEIKRVTSATKNERDELRKSIEEKHKLEQANNKTIASTNKNTVAVQDNGGAIAMLDMVTGGYASILKNAWEARTVFSSAQAAGTVADTTNTFATEANTVAKNKGILATIKDSFTKAGQTLATKRATIAQWNFNAAMAANPIGVVVVAVLALMAGVYGLIKAFQAFTDETDKLTSANDKYAKSMEGINAAQEEVIAYKKEDADQEVALAEAKGETSKAIDELKLKLADEAIARAELYEETNKETLATMENTLQKRIAADADDEVIEGARKNVETASKMLKKSTADVKSAYANKRKLTNSFIVDEAKANKAASDKAAADAVEARKTVDEAIAEYRRSKLITNEFDAEILANEEKYKTLIKLAGKNKKKVEELEEAKGAATAAINKKYGDQYNKETEVINKANNGIVNKWASADINESEASQKLKLSKQYKADQLAIGQSDNTEQALIELKKRYDAAGVLITKNFVEKRRVTAVENNAVDLEREGLSYSERADLIKERTRLLLQDEELTTAERTRIRREGAAALRQIEQAQVSDAIAFGSSMSGLLDAMAEEAGKNGEKDKSLAIASAVISGAAGIASIWGNSSDVGPTPIQIATKVAGSAVIALNTKKSIDTIKAVDIPDSKGGGGGAVAQSPTFNTVGQSAASSSDIASGAQAQIDNSDANPTRAYVVSTDVTNQQALDRAIESQGELG